MNSPGHRIARKWYDGQIRSANLTLADFIDAELARERDAGWVSVKERLPDSRKWVIVCVEHDGSRHVAPGYGVVLANDGGRFRWETEFPVTHWQELPAPPACGS